MRVIARVGNVTENVIYKDTAYYKGISLEYDGMDKDVQFEQLILKKVFAEEAFKAFERVMSFYGFQEELSSQVLTFTYNVRRRK